MNTSSCSDSSFLASADGISSAGSAEAINSEPEVQNNHKNSSPNSSIRHSTPSKTGMRFIVADSEDDDELIGESTTSGLTGGLGENASKCETTFSRTTFANNAGYPNCGTFFVQHISDDETMYGNHDNGNHLENLVDENENSSSAYASPNR